MRGDAVTLLIGRILLGGFFLYSAMNHLVLSTDALLGAAASQGVPLPGLAVIGTGVLMLVGSVSVLLGIYPRIGLACLAIFLLGVTPMMHNFWAIADPQMRMMQTGQFAKNTALLGGALAMMAIPTPWPLSVGRAARRRDSRARPV